MLQKELNDALTNESSVSFSFSVSSWGAHCNPPGSYAFKFASHGVSLLESSEGMPVWAKTAGIGWALWRQINEPLQNAVPALTMVTLFPRWRNVSAAEIPPGPPPMMTASDMADTPFFVKIRYRMIVPFYF